MNLGSVLLLLIDSRQIDVCQAFLPILFCFGIMIFRHSHSQNELRSMAFVLCEMRGKTRLKTTKTENGRDTLDNSTAPKRGAKGQL